VERDGRLGEAGLKRRRPHLLGAARTGHAAESAGSSLDRMLSVRCWVVAVRPLIEAATSTKRRRDRGGSHMARKARTSKRAVKKAKATTAAAARPTGSADLRTVHHRVTVPRAHATAIMGMHHQSKLTHAGTTAHFEVGYLTRPGPKGAALAQAIPQNCERDYLTLQQIFGGLTPHTDAVRCADPRGRDRRLALELHGDRYRRGREIGPRRGRGR
jgi:hypothetical protein